MQNANDTCVHVYSFVCVAISANKFLSHKWLTQPSIDDGSDKNATAWVYFHSYTYKFRLNHTGIFLSMKLNNEIFQREIANTNAELHRVHINTLRQPKSIKSKWRWIHCNAIRICFVNHEKLHIARACMCACDGISDASKMKWTQFIYQWNANIRCLPHYTHLHTNNRTSNKSVWNLYVRRLNFIRHRCARAFFILPCQAMPRLDTSSNILYKLCISHNAHTHILYIVQPHMKWESSRFLSSDFVQVRSSVSHTHNHVSIFPAMPLFPQRQFYRNGNFPQQNLYHKNHWRKSLNELKRKL